MTEVPTKTGRFHGLLAALCDLPVQVPGRLRARMTRFERTIARFPQRRWS